MGLAGSVEPEWTAGLQRTWAELQRILRQADVLAITQEKEVPGFNLPANESVHLCVVTHRSKVEEQGEVTEVFRRVSNAADLREVPQGVRYEDPGNGAMEQCHQPLPPTLNLRPFCAHTILNEANAGPKIR